MTEQQMIEHRKGLVLGKVAAEQISDFSDGEIQRCLGNCANARACIQVLKDMIADGLTVADVYERFPVAT